MLGKHSGLNNNIFLFLFLFDSLLKLTSVFVYIKIKLHIVDGSETQLVSNWEQNL